MTVNELILRLQVLDAPDAEVRVRAPLDSALDEHIRKGNLIEVKLDDEGAIALALDV